MPNKGISDQKQKREHWIEFCIFKLVHIINLFCRQLWIFGLNLPKKLENKKKWISTFNSSYLNYYWKFLSTEFQLELKILVSWTKFVQKWYLQPKTEKVDTTTEFCMSEIVVSVPNFSFNWQFWVFGANFPEKGISSHKQKKWPSFNLNW